jgi:methyl-accepting chemotaxis protein
VDIKAEGSFRDIANQTVMTMSTLNGVIQDINQTMKAMNVGDFSVRVQSQAYGDLLSMKETINSAMEKLDTAMKQIVAVVSAQADGDLTHLCTQEMAGRLNDVKNALNASANKLKNIVTQAVNASDIVNTAASQVAQGSSDLSARVQQQASALEQTSATMNEMSSAVQTNTANARKVTELARQVQTQSTQGVSVMQQTIGAMQSIRESSHKIADIVSLIDGIAFQTNLLALNAAVEAARAGEHGRGFAVVAGEVRALAQKSADAAKDIKTLIDDSVHRIENGTQLADKSGEMLGGISQAIEQVAGMIEEIATASNEQTIGIEQVHHAVNDIDRITQENAALVEETTAAAESLRHEAGSLHNSMTFFKTGQASSAHRPTTTHRPMTTQAKAKTAAALPAPKKASSHEWGEF